MFEVGGGFAAHPRLARAELILVKLSATRTVEDEIAAVRRSEIVPERLNEIHACA